MVYKYILETPEHSRTLQPQRPTATRQLVLECLFNHFVKICLFHYFVHIDVCLSTTCTQYPWRPDEGVSTPEPDITDGYEASHGCWELNWGPSSARATSTLD